MCRRWLTMQYSVWEVQPLDSHFGATLVGTSAEPVWLIRQVARLWSSAWGLCQERESVCVCVCVCAYALKL